MVGNIAEGLNVATELGGGEGRICDGQEGEGDSIQALSPVEGTTITRVEGSEGLAQNFLKEISTTADCEDMDVPGTFTCAERGSDGNGRDESESGGIKRPQNSRSAPLAPLSTNLAGLGLNLRNDGRGHSSTVVAYGGHSNSRNKAGIDSHGSEAAENCASVTRKDGISCQISVQQVVGDHQLASADWPQSFRCAPPYLTHSTSATLRASLGIGRRILRPP